MTKRLRGLLQSTWTRGSVGIIAAVALLFIAVPAFAAADAGDAQLGPIMNAIVWLFSFFVYAGGMALNASAYYSIVKMGAFVGSQSALQVAWATFRDIGNIAILFGFIAMGIQTILDTDSHGTRKKIVMLVIVAVAINFSSLAARAVVDVGNITALQFYKAFNGNTIPNGTTFSDNGISQKFMEVVRLQTVLNTTGTDQSPTAPGILDSAVIGFLAVVLFVIVAFVFFSLAFLFVARLVILTFLITISPLAFAAMVVPQFESQSKKWWEALLNNTFVAPLVMLLLLISTKLLESNAFQTALGNNQGAQLSAVGGAGWVNMLLTFGIATGFFVASLLIAKQLSAFGANGAINLGRKVVTYPFAFAHRTVGSPVAGSLARRYDAFAGRNPRIGGALRFVGLDNTIHSGLTAAKNVKIGGFETAEERKKRLEGRRSESSHAATVAKNKKDLSDAIAAGDDKAMARVLQGSSLHDIEEAIKTGSHDEIEAMARNMSPEKFEDAMKSKEISEDRKHDMQHGRFGALSAMAETAAGSPGALTPDQQRSIRGLAGKDLEQFAKANPAEFEKLLSADNGSDESYLTEDQLDSLAKSNVLSADQRLVARSNTRTGRVEAYLDTAGGRVPSPTDVTAATALVRNMSNKQKAKLTRGVLTNTNVIDVYDQRDLSAIMEEGKLKGADVDAITAQLRTTPPGPRRTALEEYFRTNFYAKAYYNW
ncbi:MAG TPA: hypothetical protein VF439_02345 [Candidatus Paceibacterota bacterium]